MYVRKLWKPSIIIISKIRKKLKKEFGDNPYELKNILKYWVRSPKEGLQMIPTDSLVIKLDKRGYQTFRYAGS